jgi:hypothetical protein
MRTSLIISLFTLAFRLEAFAPRTFRWRRTSASTSTRTTHPVLPLRANQLVEFREPTTNVTVILVGSMHYNPISIQLAEETIDHLGREGMLGSVVIESCDIRWETTTNMPTYLQTWLKSEMRGACDTAMAYHRPVVLGDQRINITIASLQTGLKETLVDLASPLDGGWLRFYTSVRHAAVDALPLGDAYLNPTAFFEPKLILAAPMSLIKYPLSFLVKSPLPTLGLFGALFLADYTDTSTPMDEMTIVDWLESLAVVGLEFTIFSRVFVKELLADRNEILAKNILEQCKLYQYNNKKQKQPEHWWSSLFAQWMMQSKPSSTSELDIVYVSDSINKSNGGGSHESEEKTVVAVLGMAHCNGIRKLLMEQRVT